MHSLVRIFKKITNNPWILLEKLLYTKIGRTIPTKQYLKIQYRGKFKKKLNFKNPKTYAEKIQLLKISNFDNSLSKLVDKYEVRKYIGEKIGEEFLIPLIGVYNSPDEIDFSKLPNQFVLKCTHDSQSVVICWDKNDFNIEDAKKKLFSNLQKNAYNYSREYFYKELPRRIICEEIIGDGKNAPLDYKFMCFNGKVQFIIIDYDRFTAHSRDFYDVDWNRLKITTDCPISTYEQSKPKLLPQMIDICEKLSANYKHVRVDLYCVNNKIYFGELTFMPWAGLIEFSPNDWNYKLGNLIDI